MAKSIDTQATQTSNKGGILKVLARLATTGIISFGIGGAVTFDRYNNYWNQTIFRVQTVDFNILSHTLPTKLSYAIIKNELEEIQRTLDSNYNLFGLIVTDSSGQKIIAYSGKNSGKSSSWKAALDPQQLQNHPYDVLLDPPPVFAQWTYSKPQATERSANSFTNQGRVIGRIYYVRGVRPTFQEDLMTLLSNPFSGSSRIQTYTTSLAACLGGTFLVWSILEFILYKRRIERKKAQETEEDLINNNQILQFQLSERINELELLQQQRDDERNGFEQEANNLRSLNNKLKDELLNFRESIKNLSENRSSDQLESELEKSKLQLENLQNSLSEYQEQEKILKKLAEQAKAESEALILEIAVAKEDMGQHPLNDFEIAIKEALEQNFFNSRIEIQFDVGSGKQGSKFTDFILVTNKSCIILEAKSYKGVIKPIDNVRNSGWICQQTGRKLHISSCWGKNPYHQLKNYCDSLMKNKGLGIQNRLTIYGVVVFPKGSCIDESIKSNMGQFYRVTTLDNLITTIQELDNKANSWN
ncbi:NERD domain-containing protein [Calothrix sp. FACHB-156]|nr:NERD domain-containing protein [Calothrix sp. FACHB-156]